jgi:hypothetical protein
MPGQKNAGNKGRKKESMVAIRHNNLVADFMNDLSKDEDLSGVHIGRVTRKLGNGRVEVMYVAMEKEKTFNRNGDEIEEDSPVSHTVQAIIKGSFRGRGKHSVWVEQGGIVVLNDTGLGIFEVSAVLTQDQLNKIAKTSFVDSRILTPASADSEEANNSGVVFTNDVDEKDELDIDKI